MSRLILGGFCQDVPLQERLPVSSEEKLIPNLTGLWWLFSSILLWNNETSSSRYCWLCATSPHYFCTHWITSLKLSQFCSWKPKNQESKIAAAMPSFHACLEHIQGCHMYFAFLHKEKLKTGINFHGNKTPQKQKGNGPDVFRIDLPSISLMRIQDRKGKQWLSPATWQRKSCSWNLTDCWLYLHAKKLKGIADSFFPSWIFFPDQVDVSACLALWSRLG